MLKITIINKIQNFINSFFLNFSMCLYCNNKMLGNYLCNECWKKLEFWNNNLCPICGENIMIECYNCNINIKTLLIYNSILKFLMIKFKYGNKFFIGEFFVNLILININIFEEEKNYIILYIPHYWSKQFTTSINSSMFLAYELKKKLHTSIIYHNILIKNNPLRQKDSKNHTERHNINEKYSINLNKIHLLTNQNVILIDDITTTGATILTANKLIRKAYPKSLIVLTVGKVFY
jgi:competence protein ComFC